MKSIEKTARRKNLTGSPRESCDHCGNTGFVVWDSGDPFDAVWAKRVAGMPLKERQEKGLHRAVYGEAMAPCPYCEKGFAEEFPSQDRDPKRPAPIDVPWDKDDGFWASHDQAHIEPAYPHGTKPLTLEENRRRLFELRQKMGFVAKDMPSGADYE